MEQIEFTIKRGWAKRSENDDKSIYHKNVKNLESIKDLEKWVKENVMDFPEGKMFETLLGSEDLFDNPGLNNHEGARPFVENIMENREIIRADNSREIGFHTFLRALYSDLFKEKARGLVLRNTEVKIGATAYRTMRMELGIFLDEIMKHGSVIQGNHGRDYLSVDKFLMEHIKNHRFDFTTKEKIGSFEIQVYCKEVTVPKNKWLLMLLEERH